MTLFDVPEVYESPTLEQRFQAFITEHPDVVVELHRLTVDLLAQGHKRIGIAMLWEHLRLRTLLGEFGPGYRLNNSYRSRMARHLMSLDPRLEGAFETRSLADDFPTNAQERANAR